MEPLEYIKKKARNKSKVIVYPEGEDKRIIQAASMCIESGVLKGAVLLGDTAKITASAKELGVSLKGCEILNPKTSDKIDKFAEILFELRKHKGISIDDARQNVTQNLYFAGLIVRTGEADGFVGGSVNTTGATVRAVLQTLGLADGVSTLCSFFIMDVPNCNYGENGLFLYADCGVIPDPSPRQLANITYLTAKAFKDLFDHDARCALLSYSTKGSAEGDSVTKVRKALEIINEKYPHVIADGEMQVDAALVSDVAKIKMGASPVAGCANVLIFPDLASGNIAYKLTERLAKAKAVGPILAGTAYPANDLSRGCSVEDVINVTAVTLLQS
ncbi:MAG: phosphate acetyltransferase [Elusimicrobiota bacterium]